MRDHTPADTLSQADILIIHRLTLLASTYARGLGAILKGIRDPGPCPEPGEGRPSS